MNGPVAVVTGAGRGAGAAIAAALARAGARVAVVDVNPNAAERVAGEIAAAGGQARAETLDVSNKMAVQTLLYELLEAWGRLDLVVNCAHVAPGSPALTMDEWEWNRTLDVNLKAVFLMSQTAARAMQATAGGMILNVVRRDGATHAGVAAARAGLTGLTAALAAEWLSAGVRVEALQAGADAAETAAQALERAGWLLARDTHGGPGT
jgi:NAD(P)-dependent dehydrogenase (short-subunit alcohol dehydrogenase family)